MCFCAPLETVQSNGSHDSADNQNNMANEHATKAAKHYTHSCCAPLAALGASIVYISYRFSGTERVAMSAVCVISIGHSALENPVSCGMHADVPSDKPLCGSERRSNWGKKTPKSTQKHTNNAE